MREHSRKHYEASLQRFWAGQSKPFPLEFPLDTSTILEMFRLMGYRTTHKMLHFLFGRKYLERPVKAQGRLAWTLEKVYELHNVLETHQCWASYPSPHDAKKPLPQLADEVAHCLAFAKPEEREGIIEELHPFFLLTYLAAATDHHTQGILLETAVKKFRIKDVEFTWPKQPILAR